MTNLTKVCHCLNLTKQLCCLILTNWLRCLNPTIPVCALTITKCFSFRLWSADLALVGDHLLYAAQEQARERALRESPQSRSVCG